MKYALRLLASLGCSALVVGLLVSIASHLGAGDTASDILAALRSASAAPVAAYAFCQLVQALARAQRARVLLRASLGPGARVPGPGRMLLVTFVRGACADMLPARLGELSYVAMLNRGCAVPAADCLSSLSIGLLFDFLALLAVLAAAIPAAAQGLSLLGSALALAAICAVGLVGLFFILPAAAAWRWERFKPLRWRPGARLLRLVRDVAAAVVAVRRGRVAGRVVLLSLAVRAAKYAGLYVLFLAATRPLWPELSGAPVPAVLVALVAAEGAASLPVPTFLSFGSYEAGGLAALTALGFPMGASLAAMTAMHVLSQIVDYALGGLSFLLFTWTEAPGGSPAAQPRSARARVLLAAAVAAACGAALLFAAFQWRAAAKRGRLSAPPKGEAVEPTAEQSAAREAALAAFGGEIVWSSNRSGTHDLWLWEAGAAEPRRLTRSGFTDTYPRFSPDGSKIAFSRSREPWVSQRNFDKWDTWLLDRATGEERLVATNACQACWAGGDALLFVRGDGTGRPGGTRLVGLSLAPGASAGGHEQDAEDYEIFLWDSSDANAPPVRLTFHTGNDCWPDVSAPGR